LRPLLHATCYARRANLSMNAFRWWAQTLPSVLQARGEAYLTKEEVVKLVSLLCKQIRSHTEFLLHVSMAMHTIQATQPIQVEWKLTRGKWRPNLLKYAKDASEEAVVAATKKAFACLGTAASPDMAHVEEALKELTTLKVPQHVLASALRC